MAGMWKKDRDNRLNSSLGTGIKIECRVQWEPLPIEHGIHNVFSLTNIGSL
jgi:hypothetical protein